LTSIETEVTYEQYDYYVQAQQRSGQQIESPETGKSGRGKQPVVNVSWRDAMAYATWVGEQTQRSCRLPTEAEWEYAARARTQTAYPWGDDLGFNNTNCNGCGSQWDGQQAAPVGQFDANQFGLHDMSGNVSEWTCSSWRDRFDGSEQKCITKDAYARVLRGGAWNDYPAYVRSAARNFIHPGSRFNYIGFRVLCSSPNVQARTILGTAKTKQKDHNFTKIKEAPEIENGYKNEHEGQLPTETIVTRFQTRTDPSSVVRSGGEMNFYSKIEIIKGTTTYEQEDQVQIELIIYPNIQGLDPIRSKKDVDKGLYQSGAYETKFKFKLHRDLGQGMYNYKMILYLNEKPIKESEGKFQVVI